MIREIEAGEPRILVVVGRVLRGKRRPGVPHLIFDWLEDYKKTFSLIGVVEIGTDGKRYYGKEELKRYQGGQHLTVESKSNVIEIYERKRP